MSLSIDLDKYKGGKLTLSSGKLEHAVKRSTLPRKNRRYSDDQIREMRRLHSTGVGVTRLSKMYGCNTTLATEIVRRRVYADVV